MLECSMEENAMVEMSMVPMEKLTLPNATCHATETPLSIVEVHGEIKYMKYQVQLVRLKLEQILVGGWCWSHGLPHLYSIDS